MGVYNLDSIFRPSSVAVVGASGREGTIGFALMKNMTDGGYKGPIIPINPKKYSHVKFEPADRFAKWLVSPKVQAMIAKYKIQGQQAFFPDAVPDAK